jgi:hypothetical protein
MCYTGMMAVGTTLVMWQQELDTFFSDAIVVVYSHVSSDIWSTSFLPSFSGGQCIDVMYLLLYNYINKIDIHQSLSIVSILHVYFEIN